MTDDTNNLKSTGHVDVFTRMNVETVQNSRHMSRLDQVSASMQSLEWSLLRRGGGKAPELTKTAAK